MEIKSLIVQASKQDSLIAMGATNLQPHQIDHSFGIYFHPNYHFWRGELNDTTYIAKYLNTCTATSTKTDFISINPVSANSSASFYSYSFDSESDLNNDDWNVGSSVDVFNSPWSFNLLEESTWEWAGNVGEEGSSFG